MLVLEAFATLSDEEIARLQAMIEKARTENPDS